MKNAEERFVEMLDDLIGMLENKKRAMGTFENSRSHTLTEGLPPQDEVCGKPEGTDATFAARPSAPADGLLRCPICKTDYPESSEQGRAIVKRDKCIVCIIEAREYIEMNPYEFGAT